MAECRAAARFFELTDFDPPPENAEVETLRNQAARLRGHAKALEVEGQTDLAAEYRSRAEAFERRVQALVASMRSSVAARLPGQAAPAQPTSKTPRVRDIVLDLLSAAGTNGVKAAAITRYIATTYQAQLHDKTVGMTLYRLSKEKAVHRKGQTWFFGPPEDASSMEDPENPGADTPGLTHEAA